MTEPREIEVETPHGPARVHLHRADGATAALVLGSPSRLDELDGVAVPTLLVQGEGDQFGMPPAGPQRTVARVAGSHSLHSDRQAVVDAVAAWLADVDLARSYR